jgi:hypothetical protein
VRSVLRSLLAAWRERGAGTLLVSIDRWSLAEELWSFGEDAIHLAPLQMSDEEMVRVWVLAGKVYWRCPLGRRSCGSLGCLDHRREGTAARSHKA